MVMLTRAGHHSSSRSNHGFHPDHPMKGIARSALVTMAGRRRHGCRCSASTSRPDGGSGARGGTRRSSTLST